MYVKENQSAFDRPWLSRSSQNKDGGEPSPHPSPPHLLPTFIFSGFRVPQAKSWKDSEGGGKENPGGEGGRGGRLSLEDMVVADVCTRKSSCPSKSFV